MLEEKLCRDCIFAQTNPHPTSSPLRRLFFFSKKKTIGRSGQSMVEKSVESNLVMFLKSCFGVKKVNTFMHGPRGTASFVTKTF